MKHRAFSVSTFTVEIAATVRGPLPAVPFSRIARRILPRRYTLSLVLCADARARRINRMYRRKKFGKSYSPNVLSFNLNEREGEIFLNVRKAAREARALRITTNARIAHLFVHGCLHLFGLSHGKAMDAREKKILKEFGFA